MVRKVTPKKYTTAPRKAAETATATLAATPKVELPKATIAPTATSAATAPATATAPVAATAALAKPESSCSLVATATSCGCDTTPANESSKTVKPTVAELTAQLQDDSESAREQAATELGRSADRQAVAPLIAALRDPDANVAREAAASLGQLGDASAVEPLIAIVCDTDRYFHSVVRSAAAQSLGQLKDKRAIEPLIALVEDPSAELSTEAVRALASFDDPRVIATLLEVLRNEAGYFIHIVRLAAVRALSHLGDGPAAEALAAVAVNELEDPAIRHAAHQAGVSACGQGCGH